jgi:hypothetical protein
MPERTVWSRVEPRPRSDEMDDGLAARVRDPLWMLSRQWQVSEFRGEDAGSPVRVDLSVAQDDLTRVDLRGGGRADPDPFDYDGGPLEALVEREAVTSDDDDGPPLRVRAETGQQFRRRLAEAGYGEYTAGDFPDALVLSDPGEAMPAEDRRYVELLSGRTLDGTAVARAIRSAVGNIDAVVAGEAPSWSGVTAADLPLPESGSRTGVFEDCVESFYAWYTDLYDEPTVETGSAWDPTRLEYRFAVATGEGDTETVFEAPGYQGGRLDWHAFSPDEMGASLGAGNSSTGTGNGQSESASAGDYPEGHATTVREKSVVPSQISFPGMPAPRWWEFEDGDTDLAEVAADGASLSRLTLVEFATQYGNDWFQIPVETPVGTCSRVTDLTVTDSFGVTASASAALDEDWQLFMHDLPGEPGLFVPPTLSDSMTGDPVERVVFARDEVANLAFAIERTIESPTGRALDRTEFQQPRLVVDSVATSTDPDAEYVQLANPGEDRLFVAGHEIQADTDGNTTSVYTIARQELGPGETIRVYTGMGDDDGGLDECRHGTGRRQRRPRRRPAPALAALGGAGGLPPLDGRAALLVPLHRRRRRATRTGAVARCRESRTPNRVDSPPARGDSASRERPAPGRRGHVSGPRRGNHPDRARGHPAVPVRPLERRRWASLEYARESHRRHATHERPAVRYPRRTGVATSGTLGAQDWS